MDRAKEILLKHVLTNFFCVPEKSLLAFGNINSKHTSSNIDRVMISNNQIYIRVMH